MNETAKLGLSSLLTAGALGDAAAGPGRLCQPRFRLPRRQRHHPGDLRHRRRQHPADRRHRVRFAGTSAYRSVDMTAGWRAVAKDVFGSPTTDVIFTRTVDRAKVEVIYRSGRLEIKR
jgi:hypothetical protein